jgi:tetratricopeptide (TPR) repeat protein
MTFKKTDAKQDFEYYNDADELFNDGRYDEAIPLLDRAIKINGNRQEYYSKRSWCELYVNDPEKAIADINTALSMEIKPEYYVVKAYALWDEGKKEETMKAMDAAINTDPKNPDYYYIKGDFMLDDGKYDLSIEEYDKAVKILPDVYQYHYGKAMAYSYAEKYPEAMEEYNHVIKINPNFGEAYYNRGIVYLDRGDFKEAYDDAKRASELEPDMPDNFDLMGNALLELEKYDDALNNFQHAKDLDPDYDDAYYDMGILYDRMGKYEDAIASYDRAIEITDDYGMSHSWSNASVPAFMNKAYDLERIGRREDAIETYGEVAARDPGRLDATLKMCHQMYELGKYDDVITQLSPIFTYDLDEIKNLAETGKCSDTDLASALEDLVNSCLATGKKNNIDSYAAIMLELDPENNLASGLKKNR